MTDEAERRAMEWLERYIQFKEHPEGVPVGVNAEVLRTLKRMLSRPVLPEEPSEELLRAMFNVQMRFADRNEYRRAYRALYAHLTKPAVKEVEVWRVEAAQRMDGGAYWSPFVEVFRLEQDAKDEANRLRCSQYQAYACIRVTGPHKQEIPV